MKSKGWSKNKSALTQRQGLCVFDTTDEEIGQYYYFEGEEEEIMGLDETEILEMDIEILEELGYGRTEARSTLMACKGNLEQAIRILLEEEVLELENEDETDEELEIESGERYETEKDDDKEEVELIEKIRL